MATITFFGMSQSTRIGLFVGVMANASFILLATCALLFAVRSILGAPAHVMGSYKVWLFSLLASAALAFIYMSDHALTEFSRALGYAVIISVLARAMWIFVSTTNYFGRRERIFIWSLGSIIGTYALAVVVDLMIRNDIVYYVAFTMAQNIGFVAMLGGIYSYYILQLVEEREHDALTDPLTGVYNRRFLTKNKEWLHHHVIRPETNMCLIALDIDHFKQINDTYGHQTGDDVIIRLTQTIKRMVRSNDIVIRSGGDEFIILLPEQSLENTADCARRLLLAIENEIFTYAGSPFSASATCGVAGVMNQWEQLFRMADAALYEAKSKGRNQVGVANNI